MHCIILNNGIQYLLEESLQRLPSRLPFTKTLHRLVMLGSGKLKCMEVFTYLQLPPRNWPQSAVLTHDEILAVLF